MSRGLNNPKAFSTQDEAENPTITAPQITDASDFPHTGLIKALSLGMRGNYATTGFNATSVTDVAVTFANGVVFRDGEEVGVTGDTITIGSTTGTTTAHTTGYHLVVNETGTTTLTVRPPTSADAVPEYDDDDVIIAILAYTGSTPMQIQYLTVNKDKNSLSVARNLSGTYTESLTIKSNVGNVEIESKEEDKDIIFKVNDGGVSTEAMRIDGATSHVGIGTDSPATLLHIKSSGTGEPKITIENTNSDAQEPQLEFKKNGSSPANSDDLGIIRFVGDDSNGSAHLYSYIMADSETVTAGAENGRIFFFNSKAGTTHEVIGISHDEIVINEAGVDTNFRIEGDGDANLFFVDAGNDRVGIGTSSPTGLFHVKGTSASDIDFMVEVAEDGASASPDIVYFRNSASPANGDDLAHIRFRGRDSAGNTADYVDIFAEIVDTTDGSEDGRITFRTLKNGSIISRIELDSDETVINDGGADVNFRVEGDTEANLFFVDAGNDRVGIGTNSPDVDLDVKKSTTTIARVASTGSHANLRFGRASSSYDAALLFYDNMGSTPSLQWRIQMTNGGTDLSIRDEDGSPDGQEIMKFKDGGGIDINCDVEMPAAHTLRTGEIEIEGNLNHDGSNVGFYGTTPATQQSVGNLPSSNMSPIPPTNPTASAGFEPTNEAYLQGLEQDIGDLRTKLDALIDALQLIGLIS